MVHGRNSCLSSVQFCSDFCCQYFTDSCSFCCRLEDAGKSRNNLMQELQLERDKCKSLEAQVSAHLTKVTVTSSVSFFCVCLQHYILLVEVN